MPGLEYCVVDAFTETPFQGNPAAVVFGGDDLTDTAKQRIAAEFNLSETVFILRPTADQRSATVRLRWFTPQCEVSFCGHATLAAVHAFCERNGKELGEVGVECAAGKLRVKVEKFRDGARSYWLSMPSPDVRPVELSTSAFTGALRLPPDAHVEAPVFRTRDCDVILFMPLG